MLSFLLRGGVVMAPLAVLSVVALAVIVERGIVLRRFRSRSEDLGATALERLRAGGRSELVAELETMTAPEARVLLAGARPLTLGREEREALMQLEAMRVMAAMEERVSWLSSIANVATLLGLLGTVTGMIGAFARVQAAGYTNPTLLSGGISEALISTAAGLAVAIPSLVAYHLFAHVVGRAATRMEIASSRLSAYMADRGGAVRASRAPQVSRSASTPSRRGGQGSP